MRQKKEITATALPLLATFSLLTGFTLTGLVLQAVAVVGAANPGNALAGVTAVGSAALATGITFVIASFVGRRMSDSVGSSTDGSRGHWT